jgi:histidyl-tRNA synthetase
MIQPRTLKGFRDYLPEVMIPREHCLEMSRRVFRRFGFVPIDTPALEYLEILAGKGSEETDRQIYRFQDAGGREVGLRFDLTVPLARFVSQHAHDLGTPFKRYHLASVWRGESPQAGRYREFMQCDFDTIGTENVVADIETLVVIHDLLCELGIDAFRIHVNNREILNGFLQQWGVVEKGGLVLRAMDKFSKIGEAGVTKELVDQVGLASEQVAGILKLASIRGPAELALTQVAEIAAGNELVHIGCDRLRTILQGALASGVAAERIHIDLSIARGLDYYTGVVFETLLDQLPGIGSICSGGRYDNLTSMFTKQHLPGVGASLGLDRLLAALEQLDQLPKRRTTAEVLIVYFEPSRRDEYFQMAASLRLANIGVEMFPDPKKLGQQLKYADQRGFRFAIIAGESEFAKGIVQVKDLPSKTSSEVHWSAEKPGPLIDALSR